MGSVARLRGLHEEVKHSVANHLPGDLRMRPWGQRGANGKAVDEFLAKPKIDVPLRDWTIQDGLCRNLSLDPAIETVCNRIHLATGEHFVKRAMKWSFAPKIQLAGNG
jgi:hypothetical protein